MQIAGEAEGGVGDHPYMFQCTWSEKNGRPPQFFLGSSLAGYSWRHNETGEWETVLKQARFRLVGTHARRGGYTFNNSPLRSGGWDAGTRFGNCAETYPFVELME